MPKRTNPFGECSPLQYKTHVGKKELDLGVNKEKYMEDVYERTQKLLFAGALKKGQVIDANSNLVAAGDPVRSIHVSRVDTGQLCLNNECQLTAPLIEHENNKMDTSSAMISAKAQTSQPLVPDAQNVPDLLPGQMCISHDCQLTAPVAPDSSSNMDTAAEDMFVFRKESCKTKASSVCCSNCPANSRTSCSFCEKTICPVCARRCYHCGGAFCQLCSVLNYEGLSERAFCLNCSSV